MIDLRAVIIKTEGRRPNGFLGLSLIDRSNIILVILLDETVSVGSLHYDARLEEKKKNRSSMAPLRSFGPSFRSFPTPDDRRTTRGIRPRPSARARKCRLPKALGIQSEKAPSIDSFGLQHLGVEGLLNFDHNVPFL